MAIYTLRSGATAHPEDSVLQFYTDFTQVAGVLGATHFAVSQKSGTPDMSVDIATGRAYVYSSSLGTNSYPVRSTAVENLAITANSSGNPRIDAVVLFIDLSASPAADGTAVAKLQVVLGTPAASPVAPTDGEIATAIGSANPFIRLANVAVASGATSIVDANITDTRPYVQMDVPNLVDESSVGMNRQALINSNFDIWQRQTSFTPVDLTLTYTADHWWNYVNKSGGTLPTLSESRIALTSGDIPSAVYGYRLTSNGAGTGFGAFAVHLIGQRIEDGTYFLCGAGKKITLSFWARSSITNKRIGVAMIQAYGSGGSPSTQDTLTGTNFTLTTAWKKYTYTFTTATLVGKTFGTNLNVLLELDMAVMWGSSNAVNYGATTAETYVGSGTLDIAQVQVCSGEVALPYCPQTFETELLACQRYYEKSYDYTQFPGLAAGNSPLQWDFGVNMNGYLTSVFYKVKKCKAAVAVQFTAYDVAGNANRISTKATALGVFTNNVAYTPSANYEWGYNLYTTQNPIQGIAFHYTAQKEL